MLVKISREDRNRLSVKQQFEQNATIEDLLNVLETKFMVSDFEIDIMVGYPPRVVAYDNNSTRLSSIGFKSGEVITIKSNDNKKALFQKLINFGYVTSVCARAVRIIETNDDELIREICDQLQEDNVANQSMTIVRRVIDADNSCLFNAVGYLMSDSNNQKNALHYRNIVASAIRSDSSQYSTTMIDANMSSDEYADWILDPQKWGGEIEMSILAFKLQVEIAAVDIETGMVYVYGERQWNDRIYVLYDGIHYDSLVLGINDSIATKKYDVKKFNSSDSEILKQVQQVAKELKTKKSFVNLSGCELMCNICHIGLKGQKEAVEHAKITGHQNFGQVV